MDHNQHDHATRKATQQRRRSKRFPAHRRRSNMVPATAQPGAQTAHLYALDPTTTLYTFMIKTDPSVKTVHLLGSWDNFAMTYTMERDARRERGQWRGCHTFNNIICDGDDNNNSSSSSSSTNTASNTAPRNGGLKMGHTYYYYYELDGTTETHDPARPSTTTCPYLPGQVVNTLWVPEEKSSRDRTGSVNSVDHCDFKTMNPADRFVNPQPPIAMANNSSHPALPPRPASNPRSQSPVPAAAPAHQHHQHRLLLRHQRSAQSLASVHSTTSTASGNGSSWSPRRLFNRKASPTRDGNTLKPEAASGAAHTYEDIQQPHRHQAPPLPLPSRLRAIASSSNLSMHRCRDVAPSVRSFSSAASSQGTRSRDISPDSLRRFLVEDGPLDGSTATTATTATTAPGKGEAETKEAVASLSSKTAAAAADDDDDEEEDDDEHNFAGSAVSESAPFTVLSPPPPPRSATLTPPQDDQIVQSSTTDRTVVPEKNSTNTQSVTALPPTRTPPAVPAPIAIRPMPLSLPLALRTATLPPPPPPQSSSSGLHAPSPLSPPASPLSFLTPGLLPDGSQLSSFSDSEDDDEEEEEVDFYDSQNHAADGTDPNSNNNNSSSNNNPNPNKKASASPVALVLPASELGGFPASTYSSGDFSSEFSSEFSGEFSGEFASEFHDCLEFQQPTAEFSDYCRSSLTSKSSRRRSRSLGLAQTSQTPPTPPTRAPSAKHPPPTGRRRARSQSKTSSSISTAMGYLPAAAAAAAVGRRNTPGLEDLVDELGWMATAIEN